MATDYNPYQAYTEGSVFSENPLSLIVKLYEGAIDSVANAERALAARDIMGRGKAVNKAYAILSELMAALDHEKGAEISGNLQRLYGYMQEKLLTAHLNQQAEPLREVKQLLNTLLDAWRDVANDPGVYSASVSHAVAGTRSTASPAVSVLHSGYRSAYVDEATSRSSMAYSF